MISNANSMGCFLSLSHLHLLLDFILSKNAEMLFYLYSTVWLSHAVYANISYLLC